jgi:hypothetical protein
VRCFITCTSAKRNCDNHVSVDEMGSVFDMNRGEEECI